MYLGSGFPLTWVGTTDNVKQEFRGTSMAKQKNPLRLTIEGRPEDHGDIRINEFLEFLGNTLRCLRAVDKHVSGKENPTADYKIVGLSRGSAATVELEPITPVGVEDITVQILDVFTEGIESIQEHGEAPPHFDRQLMESFKSLARPLSKRATRIEVRGRKKKIRITKALEVQVDKLIGEDIETSGSIGGQLDIVNVHGKNAFFIYPAIGPRIECYFDEEQLDEVKSGLKRFVDVSGTLRYKPSEIYPYRVDVSSVEIYPPEDELPSLQSLRGSAPGITGDMDSVEFVHKLRSEW